jgi:branched-chain amino acid transport system ATP-binding protein
MEGLAPILVRDLAAVLRELAAGGAMAMILVEQHPRLALSLTQRALVMERGRIVHDGPSAPLLAEPARLERWLAVA